MRLAFDIVLSYSSKGGSPLSELPGQADFGAGVCVGGGCLCVCGGGGGVLGIRDRLVIFVKKVT